ncbi:GNAT family N-acetyltransferase [Streptomyces sp. CC224B]|uniref:GNAT family N-acetyltransferase n=1 Tax=Streptomyces sp. CC224B TaxID=3044571 RepID=UPI0024A85C6F|nr:GNAT family N-acetyltransferase [Streptomyces sp. CC224B]
MDSAPLSPAPSTITFRDLPDTDLDRALDLLYLVFHETPEDEKRKHHHDLLRGCDRVGAYDGETLVGLLAAFRFTLSVPGGELPCPGVSFVSVAPTHRRRGVLSGLIAELFGRCRAEDRPLAALWASEDAIYGRFGFGPATYGTTVEINTERPLALRVTPADGPLRLVDPASAPELLADYYDRTRSARAGRIHRTDAWWSEEWMVTEDEDDDDLSPPRVVVLGTREDPEAVAGYAIYRTKSRGDASGMIRLDDLEADTPQGAAALWRYLASIDLTGLVRAWGRPLDDPLLHFAGDRDQVRVTGHFPALRVRLVDVRAALLGRSWAAPADLVLEVRDTRLPANDGRFRLRTTASGTGTGAAYEAAYDPTEAPADLTLDVRDLASAYLGGATVASFVRAGVATEHTPGVAAALDAALRTELLPHTSDEF